MTPAERLDVLERALNDRSLLVAGDALWNERYYLLRIARAAVAWREMLKDDETELVRIFGHDELTAIMDAVESE